MGNIPTNDALVWPTWPLGLTELLQAGAAAFDEQQLFFGHGTDNSWDEAVMLALHVLDLPWDVAPERAEAALTEERCQTIFQLFEQRIAERVPAAYLTGEAYFAGLPFHVNRDVLVPRSPFAELIGNGFQPWLSREPERILDMCTGGGCIGIASALYFPESRVDLADISAAALAVADNNVVRHQVADRVCSVQSDGFSQLPDRYDLILCNPPYVDAEDLAAMPDEFRAEPAIALGSGADGMDFCRVFLPQVADHLHDGGLLFIEVGNSWLALEEAFPRLPFTWIELEYGGHGLAVLTKAELEGGFRPGK